MSMLRSTRPSDLDIQQVTQLSFDCVDSPSKSLAYFDTLVNMPLTPLFQAPVFTHEEQMAMDSHFRPFAADQFPPSQEYMLGQASRFQKARIECLYSEEVSQCQDYSYSQNQSHSQSQPQPQDYRQFEESPLSSSLGSSPQNFEMIQLGVPDSLYEEFPISPSTPEWCPDNWIETPESRLPLVDEETKRKEAILQKRLREAHLNEFQLRYIQDTRVRNSGPNSVKNSKKCLKCNQVFSNMGQYAFHYQSHGRKTGSHGAKRQFCPYTGCPYASIGFGTQQILRRHVQSKHGSNRLECPNCLRAFCRKDGLKRHVLARFCSKITRDTALEHSMTMDALASEVGAL